MSSPKKNNGINFLYTMNMKKALIFYNEYDILYENIRKKE